MLQQITDFILSATTSVWAYGLLMLLILGDALIPAIPSESVVISMASVLVHSHPALLVVLFVVAAVAAWCGDNITYSIGRAPWLSGSRLWRQPKIAKAVEYARQELFRRGATFIIVGRFIPGVRIAINLVCGVVGYSRRRYMGVVAASSSLWGLYCVVVGSLAGAWFRDNPVFGIVVAIAAGMVLGPVIDWLLRRTVLRTPEGTDSEVRADDSQADDSLADDTRTDDTGADTQAGDS